METYAGDIQRDEKVRKLSEILPWIKGNEDRVIVFLDWDQTIVKNSTSSLLDVNDAKKFFGYLDERRIPWRILTGRFSNYVCNPNQKEVEHGLSIMKRSILEYMYKALDEIGTRKDFNQDPSTYVPMMLNDQCVGMSYMGILFGTDKGGVIKSFMENFGNDKRVVDRIPILVDDNVDFINNAKKYGIQTFQKI